MKSILIQRLLALIIALATAACRPPVRAASPLTVPLVTPDADGIAVIALERRMWDAERRRDRAGVDSLIAPDFVYLSAIARRDRSKMEDLDNRFGPHVLLEGYDLKAIRTVRVAEDVIALHFIADQRIRTDGALICPHTGTSETWARRRDRWLLVTRTEYVIGGEEPPPCPKPGN